MQTSNAAFRGPDCMVPRQPPFARLTKGPFCKQVISAIACPALAFRQRRGHHYLMPTEPCSSYALASPQLRRISHQLLVPHWAICRLNCASNMVTIMGTPAQSGFVIKQLILAVWRLLKKLYMEDCPARKMVLPVVESSFMCLAYPQYVTSGFDQPMSFPASVGRWERQEGCLGAWTVLSWWLCPSGSFPG
jgi:hypothetical protein